MNKSNYASLPLALCLLVSLFLSQPVSGQVRIDNQSSVASSSSAATQDVNLKEYADSLAGNTLVDNYVDSLQQYRHLVDSLSQANRNLTGKLMNMKYLRLFMPMTFYQDLAGHRLGIGTSQTVGDELVDNALLSVYLNHPSLITGTQKQLDDAGITIEDTKPVIATPTNITEKAPAAPEEPEAEKVKVMVEKPNFWKVSGNFNMHVNQLAFSGNWHQTHENNYNMLSTLTLRANYNNKQKVKWDNTLDVRLGMQTTKADTLRGMRTTEDLLRYTGNLGLQAIKRWDYTFQVIATTQSLKGYPVNSESVISDIFSPITVNASVGMKYNISLFKNKLTGSINFGALSYNWKYCGRSKLVKRNGIEEGHHTFKDYGSNITINTLFKFSPDVSWKMRLYGYTSYKRALVEIENTIDFKISKYFSCSFYIYPRFDDNRARDEHHAYWAFKETLSFGLSYSL